MTTKEITTAVQSATGIKVRVKDNGNVFTVSLADSTGVGFGYVVNELKAAFSVTRLDGLSFDIAK